MSTPWQAIRAGVVPTVAVSALLPWLASVLAHAPHIENVLIFERGIYEAEAQGQLMEQGTLGPVQRVATVRLLSSTTSIPGRPFVRFGLRYAVIGMPQGAAIEVRHVTRFPPDGIVDPRSGIRHHRSEYTIRHVLGEIGYREFHFDDVSEIIYGQWIFEFWVGTSKIGEQKFCVYEPDASVSNSQAIADECPVSIV